MVDLVLGNDGIAEGRARHRPDHGAVRAPPVRRRALRRDARDQAAVRPARHAQPAASCSTRTRPSHMRHLKSAPDRRGRGRPLRRVRLLRAGLPQQGPHDRRRASGSSCGGRSARARSWPATSPWSPSSSPTTSTRRSTPAPSTACARPRARSTSTPATWSGDCAPSGTGRSQQALWDSGCSALGQGRPRRRHRALTVGRHAAPRWRSPARRRLGRRAARGRHGSRWTTERLPRGGAARRPVPAADPDAVYFPACVATMFGPGRRRRGGLGRVPRPVRAGGRDRPRARRRSPTCAAARRGSPRVCLPGSSG